MNVRVSMTSHQRLISFCLCFSVDTFRNSMFFLASWANTKLLGLKIFSVVYIRFVWPVILISILQWLYWILSPLLYDSHLFCSENKHIIYGTFTGSLKNEKKKKTLETSVETLCIKRQYKYTDPRNGGNKKTLEMEKHEVVARGKETGPEISMWDIAKLANMKLLLLTIRRICLAYVYLVWP